MSTVTPRSADTFEASSSRRELFCLVEDCSVGVSCRAQAPVMRAPFSFVGLGHSGKRMGVLSQAACMVWSLSSIGWNAFTQKQVTCKARKRAASIATTTSILAPALRGAEPPALLVDELHTTIAPYSSSLSLAPAHCSLPYTIPFATRAR